MAEGGFNSSPYLGNKTSADNDVDKVGATGAFSSSLPSGSGSEGAVQQAGSVYGRGNYYNPNLQGTGAQRNIVRTDSLNNLSTPMNTSSVDRMRRDVLTSQNQSSQPYYQQNNYFPNQNYSGQGYPNQNYQNQGYGPYPNSGQNIPNGPNQSSQYYSQSFGSNGVPNIYTGRNGYENDNNFIKTTTSNGQTVYHDVSTAEGSLKYLNSISPGGTLSSNSSNTKANNNKFFVLLGVGAVVIVVAIAILGAAMSGSNQSDNTGPEDFAKAVAKIDEVSTYIKDKSNVNTSIKQVAIESDVVLASRIYQMKDMTSFGSSVEKGVIQPDESVAKTLDSANSNGNLDSEALNSLKKSLNDAKKAANNASSSATSDDLQQNMKNTATDIDRLIERANAVKISGSVSETDSSNTVDDNDEEEDENTEDE